MGNTTQEPRRGRMLRGLRGSLRKAPIEILMEKEVTLGSASPPGSQSTKTEMSRWQIGETTLFGKLPLPPG